MSSQDGNLKNAILFNGAASYIAQEAGMLDLLLGNISGVPGVGLNINQEETFIGGLSSGALMTFIVNAVFANDQRLSWDDFLHKILFPMKTKQVHTGIFYPYDTKPLKNFLTEKCAELRYHTLKDLPFDSAILTVPKKGLFRYGQTCWLTNILDLANKLPAGDGVYENIRNHQLNLELVSSLMCSTAIPFFFPEQKLYYKDGSEHRAITSRLDWHAKFMDGGTLGVFNGFQEFFDIYGEKFDNIYFISPDFVKNEKEAYELIKPEDLESEQNSIELSLDFNDSTNKFINELKKYNVDGHLANKIYYCKPKIDNHYNALKFDYEKAQYNDTISWGRNNPSKIKIDINDL